MIVDQIKIETCKGVYMPREDSYLLAEATEKYAKGRVLDLGTGSGINGIVAAKNGCSVTFADVSSIALACARHNANLNDVKGKFVSTNLFSNIKGKYNTIMFNPPYLHSKPIGVNSSNNGDDVAVDGGVDGRELINSFLNLYHNYVLEDHHVLLLESSLNRYEEDVNKYKAEVVGIKKFMFETLAVLKIV
ncbi:methylase [mine drainage metagenome]|uniref:Methylase n=1 Tax=mine drainage metagenome TaxID=410659 RepID=T1C386_9ZZZZ